MLRLSVEKVRGRNLDLTGDSVVVVVVVRVRKFLNLVRARSRVRGDEEGWEEAELVDDANLDLERFLVLVRVLGSGLDGACLL